jgi:hypothetical protein
MKGSVFLLMIFCTSHFIIVHIILQSAAGPKWAAAQIHYNREFENRIFCDLVFDLLLTSMSFIANPIQI